MQTGLHPSISGLVNELARNGINWTLEERRLWESALSAMLDLVLPNTRKKNGGEEYRMGQALDRSQTRQPSPPEVDIATE